MQRSRNRALRTLQFQEYRKQFSVCLKCSQYCRGRCPPPSPWSVPWQTIKKRKKFLSMVCPLTDHGDNPTKNEGLWRHKPWRRWYEHNFWPMIVAWGHWLRPPAGGLWLNNSKNPRTTPWSIDSAPLEFSQNYQYFLCWRLWWRYRPSKMVFN